MFLIVIVGRYLPEPLVTERPLRVDEPPEAGAGDAVIGPPLQPVDGQQPGERED